MERNKDIRSTEVIFQEMAAAIKGNDNARFLQLNQELMENIKDGVSKEFEQRFAALQEEADQAALAQRGVQALTSEEKKFYQELIQAHKAKNVKQAIDNLAEAMPPTILDRVFEDLRKRHPLLSKIRFIRTGAMAKIVYNANGKQLAAWGDLDSEIVKELTAGLKVVPTALKKLSALFALPKDQLQFGPAYVDRLVRETLYEAYADGLEGGFVDGNGKEGPIGMTRKVGPGVTVTDGVYPRKEKVQVVSLDIDDVGRLVDLVSTDDNGKDRDIKDLLILCNNHDLYTKIYPAIMVRDPQGVYRNALPYDVAIIPVSNGLQRNEMIFGLGYRYLATIGGQEGGAIDYSDQYQFAEDRRVYIIKGYSNGFPMDGNAFVLCDISKLAELRYKVSISEPVKGSNDKLADLSLGSATLSPAFDPNEDEYTAATRNASNVIRAVPADVQASVQVLVNDEEIPNGTAATWQEGENEVVITVTPADGSAKATITITVTKS